jgi:hypothetical protein
MTSVHREIERMRAMLEAAAASAAPGSECPEPDLLWRALHQELSSSAAEDVVAHIAGCPSCREAWKLAREIADSGRPEEAPQPADHPKALRTPWHMAAAAVAAAACIVIGVAIVRDRRDEPTRFRDPAPSTVSAIVSPDIPLSRDPCLLRWTPGPEGSRYQVHVATEALEVIASSGTIDAVEYQLPSEAVASLPPGSKLVWQVEVLAPDGARWSSPVFTATLE